MSHFCVDKRDDRSGRAAGLPRGPHEPVILRRLHHSPVHQPDRHLARDRPDRHAPPPVGPTIDGHLSHDVSWYCRFLVDVIPGTDAWMLIGLTAGVDFRDLLVPQGPRGLSLMMSVMPIIDLALGTLPADRTKDASGVSNLKGNLGGPSASRSSARWWPTAARCTTSACRKTSYEEAERL